MPPLAPAFGTKTIEDYLTGSVYETTTYRDPVRFGTGESSFYSDGGSCILAEGYAGDDHVRFGMSIDIADYLTVAANRPYMPTPGPTPSNPWPSYQIYRHVTGDCTATTTWFWEVNGQRTEIPLSSVYRETSQYNTEIDVYNPSPSVSYDMRKRLWKRSSWTDVDATVSTQLMFVDPTAKLAGFAYVWWPTSEQKYIRTLGAKSYLYQTTEFPWNATWRESLQDAWDVDGWGTPGSTPFILSDIATPPFSEAVGISAGYNADLILSTPAGLTRYQWNRGEVVFFNHPLWWRRPQYATYLPVNSVVHSRPPCMTVKLMRFAGNKTVIRVNTAYTRQGVLGALYGSNWSPTVTYAGQINPQPNYLISSPTEEEQQRMIDAEAEDYVSKNINPGLGYYQFPGYPWPNYATEHNPYPPPSPGP